MKNSISGFSILEIAVALFILGLMATLFLPLASGLKDTERANGETGELQALYTAVVGNPKTNTFGYLGDVGDYPATLLDLVAPSVVPTGWNGPYIRDVRIETSILYDRFGGAIEYFRPDAAPVPAAPVDQLALISKGPDRGSTNTAANPNQSSSFTGALPSSSAYGTTSGNTDNVVYPKFTDNAGLVNYQSLGQMSFNIRNYDEFSTVNDFVPGCPGLYDIVVSSVTRGANEAYMTYSPGGAFVDLLQGLYTAKVYVTGSTFPVWQQQFAVQPGVALTRDLSLPGVSSDLFATVALTVVNTSGGTVKVNEYSSLVGSAINNTTATRSVHRCSRISVINNSTNDVIDTFIMPNADLTKRYIAGASVMDLLTITNDGPSNTVSVYDDGLLVGTVGRRGNRRVKSFSLKDGHTITVRDENNAILSGTPFVLSGNTTKNY